MAQGDPTPENLKSRDARMAERLADIVASKIDIPVTIATPDAMSVLIEIRDNTDLTNALLREMLKELRKKS